MLGGGAWHMSDRLAKVLVIILAVLVVSVSGATAYVAFDSAAPPKPPLAWSELPPVQDVPLEGAWAFELPEGLDWEQVHGVAVVDEAGRLVPAYFRESNDGCLEVTPVAPYERANTYSLKLFADEQTAFAKEFTTVTYPALDLGVECLIEVPASPEQGFNYPYILFVPANLDETRKHRLLVEPNNTGFPTDEMQTHMARAREDLVIDSPYSMPIPRMMAERLGVPLLVPVFPRLYDAYTHALTRDALLIDERDPAFRVDLQLVAMIEDARNLLAHNGIRIKEKIFIDGFSASASFATRFALIHPELVRAVAAGGGTLWTLPLDTYKGRTLRYPVGIADLEDLTGIGFNMEEYRKVAHFIYWGEQDTNDTVMAPDCFHPEDSKLILSILGHSVQDRWVGTQAIYREAGAAVQFVTYKGVGHWPGNPNDVIEFFRANDNDQEGITPVTPGH